MIPNGGGLVVLVAGTLALPCPAHLRAQDLLRYQFKKGEKLEYQFAQMCSMKVKDGAQETQMLFLDHLMELFWTVRDITPDGKALILVKTNSVRLKASFLGGLINAELDREQGKPLMVDFAGKPVGFFENLAFHSMLGRSSDQPTRSAATGEVSSELLRQNQTGPTDSFISESRRGRGHSAGILQSSLYRARPADLGPCR